MTTQDPDPDLARVFAAWGLPPIERVVSLNEGRAARVLRVETAAGWFVLRRESPPTRPLAYTVSAQQWVRALAERTDLALPTPVPAKSGALVVEWPAVDGRSAIQASIARWVPGKVADDPAPQDLRALGRTMAALHEAAIGWTPPAGFVRRTWDGTGLFGDDGIVDCGPGWAVLPGASRAAFEEVAQRTGDALDALGRGAEQFAVIHADLHPTNTPLDGERAGVIDFEDCGWGWLAFDLAVPLAMLAGAVERDDPRHLALLAGYRERRPLPARWVELVPLFIAAWQVSVLVWELALLDPAVRQERVARWDRWIANAEAACARCSH